MGYPTKIATCCYCGTRAALVLKGAVRHELACATCGAPLHDLKMLRKDAGGDRELVKPSRTQRSAPEKPRVATYSRKAEEIRQSRPKKRKRRKSMFKWLIEEAWDVIEDVFD